MPPPKIWPFSFTVITPVRYYGQKETEPYIRASILLGGADSPIYGVDIRDIPPEQFRLWAALADRGE